MFVGQFHHNLDEKGRLTIPARFREELFPEGGYVLQGFEQNLMVFPASRYDDLSDKVSRMNLADPTARLLHRQVFSTASQIEIDKAGRILIPQFLRLAAGLEGDTMVVGMGRYFEIWSPEHWENQMNQLQDVESNAKRYIQLDLTAA